MEDYLADVRNQSVVKSVHVERGWTRTTRSAKPPGSNRSLTNTVFLTVIVARAELDVPDIEKILEGHAQYKNVRGIRHIVCWHQDPVKSYVRRPDL